MDFAEGKFQVPIDRWEALRESMNALLNADKGRVQARNIARLTCTAIRMHKSMGPVTQLYTRHLYPLIISVVSLDFWIELTEEEANELYF